MMDTMADISNLLTEFNARKSSIFNAKDKSGLEKDINCLKIAWNSGNAGDAIKHATNFQRLAKKYKSKFSNAFWQTFESIASGDSVPQKMDSSTRPSSKYSRRDSETAAASRGSTTKQPVKKESEMAAARKGSTTKQPVQNKSQNEKESEQERAMDVQGIKYKAHQRQSEKSMVQKLQIIRNHIEDLADAMRPRPTDVKNSNSKSEKCNSLVEIILNQSAEVLNAYRQEKDRCNRTHVEHATIRQVLKPICDAFIKTNTENMETIHMIAELGKCLNANYVSQHERIHQDSVKSKEELENLHKRLSDTEKRRMFQHATGQKYKVSSNKDGTRKPEPVEILQQTIYDLEKQLVDYTSKMADEKVANGAIRMYDMCTGEKYRPSKEPTVDSIAQLLKQKLESLSQHGRQEKEQHDQLQKEKEDLQKRISDAEQRLKDMFRNVTKQEYAFDLKKDNRKEKQSKSVDLMQLVGDIENRFEDYTRKMTDEKVANEAIRMYEMCTGEKFRPSKEPTVDSIAQLLKQKLESLSQHGRKEKGQHDLLQKEKEDLQKSISDAEQRLKDMFRNVTKQEYVSDARKDNRNEKQSKSVGLEQLVRDIENRFEDYTRKMADEKVANEAIRMYEMCTGEKYKPSNEPAVDSIAQLLNQKLDRLSLQLRDAMKTIITLKTEQDQIHQSDGMVSGRKATDDEQQESDDMVAGRKPTCEGRQDTDDMVAERKPRCTGRQETTQEDTTHDNQPQQLKYKREAWM